MLKQKPIKDILIAKSKTRVQIFYDNAPNYKSKEFLYCCTKTLNNMFSALKGNQVGSTGSSPLENKPRQEIVLVHNTLQLSERINTVKKMNEF